jgi:hypothetical protein
LVHVLLCFGVHRLDADRGVSIGRRLTPCSWSADFSIGNGCAFDATGSGSNYNFGFDFGGLDYLHHVGEEERKGCAKRRASATDSISRAAGIQRRGLYVQAIEFAAVNPPVWQVTLSRTSAKGRKRRLAWPLI